MPVAPLSRYEENDMSLGQPLLDAEHFQSKERISSAKLEEAMQAQDYLAGRIYANNAPRIFLETITARTATIVICLTYIFFIVCFSMDLNTTYKSFTSSDYTIPAYSCGSNSQQLYPHGPKAGSNYDGCSAGARWNSTVTSLENVISIQLDVQQINVTSLLVNASSTFDVVYNVSLWACYEADGCGQNFQTSDTYTTDGSIWQKVLALGSQTITVEKDRDVTSANDGTLELELIQNTFQNQESIPTNGLVKSYYIEVYYLSAPYNLFTGEDSATQQYISYEFDVANRPRQPIADGFTLVLLVLTVVVLAWYVHVVWKQKTMLSEQKWIIWYFILVILFQNPVYCIICWFKHPPTAGAAYTSYVISYLGQSGLFMLWLFFADPVRRKLKSKLFFYLPKLLLGLFIFTSSMVILTFQFPGLDPTTPSRNAVEAVQNWSDSLKLSFIAFTMIYLILIWAWTIYWFFQLIRTGRKLKKLPYMSTRYMQLSYRFFVVQATLVTLYYVLQYAAVVYFISVGAHNGDNAYDLTNLTDNINTLFRQQTQLFGKALFLSVYAMVLAFFYLPADVLDNTGLATALAATYTITEAENRSVVRQRKKALEKVKKTLLNQMTGNQLVTAKTDVFCVDLALQLRDLSFQAYYDFPDLRTASGYEGTNIDLASCGYEPIDKFYCAEYEVFCFIAREKSTQRIVVCFRGTASKKQMEANLKYSQLPVNLEEMDLPSLDQLDGLTISKNMHPELDKMEMESVSDAEEADFWENSDLESGTVLARRESEGGPGVNTTLSLRPAAHRQQLQRETIMDRAGLVGEELHKALTGAVDATNQGIHKVMDVTAELMVTAASSTPGLKKIVLPYVHQGFWEAYQMVRGFVHGKLRQELVRNPTTVMFTGHSLGGALATFAALDVSIHTIPRVNAYLKHHAKLLYMRERADRLRQNPFHAFQSDHPASRISSSAPPQRFPTSPLHSADLHQSDSEDMHLTDSRHTSANATRDEDSEAMPVFVRKIRVLMYNYGSPRVGNRSFAQLFNKCVPSAFRVVVDGDLVAGLPPSKYQHIGTEILIDALGAGSIIIDPSFVERWLRTHLKSSVAVHSLLVYRKGLLGLKLSAEYLKQQYDMEREKDPYADPLRVAIQMRTQHKIETIVDTAPDFGNILHVQAEAGMDPVPTKQAVEAGPITIVSDEHPDAIHLADLAPSRPLDPFDGAHDNRRRRMHSNHAEEVKTNTEEGQIYARHYAHDLENMNALMSQIRTLKTTSGPMQWMKKHTVGKVKKFNSKRSTSKSSLEDAANQV